MNTDPERLGPDQPLARPPVDAAEAARQRLLERLLDLAYDASSYLRRSARPVVRVSAALLLAASLAACGGATTDQDAQSSPVVSQPLTQEVRTGLPTRAGRYPLVPGTLHRDGQGIYHFSWREPNATDGPGQAAAASLVKLAEATDTEYLEIASGGDPVLGLTRDTPVPLVASSTDFAVPTPGPGGATPGYYSTYYPSHYSTWYPFYAGSYRGPAYYDPPLRTTTTAGRIDGSSSSTTPPSASSRTVAVPHTVSGRAGGTGSGSAASLKSGAGVSSGKSGASSSSVSGAKSSGFSGGKSGASAGGSSSS